VQETLDGVVEVAR